MVRALAASGGMAAKWVAMVVMVIVVLKMAATVTVMVMTIVMEMMMVEGGDGQSLAHIRGHDR